MATVETETPKKNPKNTKPVETDKPETPKPSGKDWFERWLDAHFEGPFFAMRYVTLVPVLFAFVGAILMFVIGAIESWEAISELVNKIYSHSEHASQAVAVETKLIRAIDAFLLGLVMMIFSYGIYDLFVSELSPADTAGVRPDWLKFHNISELKTTLAHVVLIILVITFFEMVLDGDDRFVEPWSFLVVPAGVLLIGLGLAVFEKGTARRGPLSETSGPKNNAGSDSSP